MSVRRSFVIATAIACGSCTSTPQASESTSAGSVVISDATTVPVPTTLFDVDDPRPLLTMASWPYLEDGPSRPRDLPFFVVYPNGQAIVFDHPSNPKWRSVSNDELDALFGAAEDAGLTGGGLQPFLAEDPPQTVDGGQGAFTFRSGDVVTARVVDQPGSGGTSERDDYRRIIDLLGALLANDAVTDRPVLDEWAITRRPFDPQADWESQRTTWDGPALDAIEWQRLGDIECAVISDFDWPYSNDELLDARYISGGTVTTRRPLLPHEDGCADVVAFRTVLGL